MSAPCEHPAGVAWCRRLGRFAVHVDPMRGGGERVGWCDDWPALFAAVREGELPGWRIETTDVRPYGWHDRIVSVAVAS